MKIKKIMSLALACVMALSLAVPAFAAAAETPLGEQTEVTEAAKLGTGTTTVNMTYQAPIIALTVPKKVAAVFNPTGANLTVNSKTALVNDEDNGVVTSADNLIISRSSVPMAIKATATAKLTGTATGDDALKLSKTDLVLTGADASTKKEAIVVLEFGTLDTSAIDTKGKVDKFMETEYAEANGVITKQPFEGVTKDDLSYPAATDLTAAALTYVNEQTAMDGIVVSTDAGKKTLVKPVLGQCEVSEDGTNADGTTKYKYESVSAVPFKLTGKLVPTPKVAWTKDDKVEVSIAWEFIPQTQIQPIKEEVYSVFDTTNSVNGDVTTIALADMVDDEHTAPAWALVNAPSGVTIDSGKIKITGAAIKAANGNANLASGKDVTIKVKLSYATSATATKTETVKVKVTGVDIEVPASYSVGSGTVTQIAAQASVASDATLTKAPTGVSVTADGKIDVTKAAVATAFGGTAPTDTGKIAFTKAFTYAGKDNSSADVSKVIVLKITSAA